MFKSYRISRCAEPFPEESAPIPHAGLLLQKRGNHPETGKHSSVTIHRQRLRTSPGHALARVPRSWMFLMAILIRAEIAHGVVTLSGGTNNLAPANQPYFNNIGVTGAGSSVYLGNRWVMTAGHVAGSLPASASFGGTSYSTVPGSYQRLTNNGQAGLSSLTDIALFRLVSDPNLPWLDIAPSTPNPGDNVMMIGNGRTQSSSPSYWIQTVNPGTSDDVWTEVTSSDPYNAAGFKTSSTKEIRWALNRIESTNTNVDTSGNNTRSVISFTTLFGGASTFTEEGQAVAGDSGGAVFTYLGSNNWTLSGMMHAVASYENQPDDTALLGQQTIAADLSFYRSQIVAISGIPEATPSSLFLIAMGGILLRRKRHPLSF